MDTTVVSPDFIVSFRESDVSWAEIVDRHLREAGYQTQLCPWHPNNNRTLLDYLLQCKGNGPIFLPIFSKAYVSTIFEYHDWVELFHHGKFPLLAVCVQDCEVQKLLPIIHYLDMSHQDRDTVKELLLKEAALKRGRSASFASPLPFKTPSSMATGSDTIPKAWQIPYKRNTQFMGRERELTLLHQTLSQNKVVLLAQPNHLYGGMGCTQLALEYAYKCSKLYPVVWWIRAHHPMTLAADYAALATALGLPEQNARSQPFVIQAVREYLEQKQSWLLIFDSAINEQEIARYLPKGNGKAIITSRNPENWPHVASRIELTPFTHDQSIEFIHKRTGQIDPRSMDELARMLGGMPLSLTLAVSYIETSFISIDEYLHLLDDCRKRLWGGTCPPQDLLYSTAVILRLSLEKIWQEVPVAVNLLKLSTYLGSVGIARSMLIGGIQYLPNSLEQIVLNPHTFKEVITFLEQYALIQTKEDIISIHPLIQAQLSCWIEDTPADATVQQEFQGLLGFGEHHPPLPMPMPDSLKWIHTALCVVKEAFPAHVHEPESWPLSSQLLSHGIAAIRHAKRKALTTSIMAEIWLRGGAYLIEREEFLQAKAALELALEYEERQHGRQHPAIPAILSNLGAVYMLLEEYAQARSIYERAVTLLRERLGKHDPAVLSELRHLGTVVRRQQDWAKACELFEYVIAIETDQNGPDTPEVVQDLANLAGTMLDMRDMQRAWLYLKKGLELSKSGCCDNHPARAELMETLGWFKHAVGELNEAKICFEKAIQSTNKVYGAGHHTLANEFRVLAQINQEMGDMEAAISHQQEALHIDEALYGADHPRIATEEREVGRLYQQQGSKDAARMHYTRAFQIVHHLYGADHPYTQSIQHDIQALAQV